MNGILFDLYRRPELTHGTVEYVATKVIEIFKKLK